MRQRNGHTHAWVPWTIAAALPLGCAALVLFWLRERRLRRELDNYEDWWLRRERVRAGDRGSSSQHDNGRTSGLFV